ncbi:MAG: NADP-dependent oxidoreductase [Myxococcota bacterium]
MKAMLYEAFGGPEVLRLGEVDEPRPADGELLVEVAYAGVNPFDWKLRRGYFGSMFEFVFPVVAGMDFAGTVTRVAGDVRGFAVGDRVMGMNFSLPMRGGSYGEFTAVAAAQVAAVPRGMSLERAAALPMAALTAAQALAELKSGDVCLIQAGAGAVGTVAIQLAKRAGAKVYTTASASNLGFVRSLGADVAIDYRAQDFAHEIDEPLDRIVDCIGGDVLAKSYDLLAPGGTLVSMVEPPDPTRYDAPMFGVVSQGEQLAPLARTFADGGLVAPRFETRPLAEGAQAHADSEAGRGLKTVLAVRP